jgi:hypothetical protein
VDIEPVTFPAAAVPERTRRRYRAGATAVLVALVVLPLTALGTGTAGWLAVMVVLVALPIAWQRGMIPDGYSLDGSHVGVHRRYLPDSRFRIVGAARRGSEDAPNPRAAASAGPVSGEEPRQIRRLDVSRRMYRAVTDGDRAVRVPVRGGTLLVSPDDPEEFIRMSEVLR